METPLRQQELDLSVDEKNFFLKLLEKNKKKLDIVNKKNSSKSTINFTLKNTVINDLIDRLSFKHFKLKDLPFSIRLHKYKDELEVPEHVDKTLFSLIYQFSDISGFKYYHNDQWNNFNYNQNKILLCFDEKSENYGFTPIPHKFLNETENLRFSLTIHVDHDLDIR